MSNSLGLFLIGMGMGVATTQFIFPILWEPIRQFFWISWFVLILAGIYFIIKG
ncbi:MAG: hypothetical protein ACOX1V_03790 [Candidatus Iainarchaeum sp.]